MIKFGWVVGVLAALLGLSGCGGGDSSSTVYHGLNSLGQSPSVSLPFTQSANNIPVAVQAGISSGFSLGPNPNLLFATVTVCAPGSTTQCQTINNIQVDTGSVGLRIMASQLSALNLPIQSVANGNGALTPVWECYGFVIGGFWGTVAVADISLGPLSASAVPIQLIQDDQSANALQATNDCYTTGATGQILNSPAALGANGILGIGNVTIDCGLTCVNNSYAANATYIQYYTCPAGTADPTQCAAAPSVPYNYQVSNPVAALPAGYNNGVVISLPAVTGVGAGSASGELIFGINTPNAPANASNNQLGTVQPVALGTNYTGNINSYLSVTTNYQGSAYQNSYLDTGSNGYFFNDTTLAQCGGATGFSASTNWYCPGTTQQKTAIVSDGDNPALDQISVAFSVANADSLFLTNNAAFGNLAGTNAPPVSTQTNPNPPSTFVWGLPFFYGKRVYLSIWDLSGNVTSWPTSWPGTSAGPWPGPWYAWTLI